MNIGPPLILDKCAFQGMNRECLPYLSRYYQHRISPILLREMQSCYKNSEWRRRSKN